MSVSFTITDEEAQEVTTKFLMHHLITMKQYMDDETRLHYLAIIDRHTSLIEFDDFMVRYERAHG